jgi:hypothetical protein
MKKLTFILLLTLNSLFSQDTIYFKSGDSLLSKVLEINLEDVKYKKFSYLEGPTYTILKTDIKEIVYQNGTKDFFALSTVQDKFSDAYLDSLAFKGKEDAKTFYTNFKKPARGVFFTTTLAMPVGLIAAIATSSSPPLIKNLNYPDSQLMRHQAYANAYKIEANKIKRKYVWNNFGGGLFLSTVILTFMYSMSR